MGGNSVHFIRVQNFRILKSRDENNIMPGGQYYCRSNENWKCLLFWVDFIDFSFAILFFHCMQTIHCV